MNIPYCQKCFNLLTEEQFEAAMQLHEHKVNDENICFGCRIKAFAEELEKVIN